MTLQFIQISACVESQTNPRGKKFNGPDFDELVTSIQQKGVLVPVLARSIDGDKYEIVAGNRRFRAAKQLNFLDVPAYIVEMTDVEAREAQIVENLQRADIHPLEEGKAYRDLIEKSGYDVAAVAAKVGKSETYVRDRLVLTDLVKEGQTAFRDELITVGHASLVARLDDKMQREALDDCLHIEQDPKWRDVPTTAELREWIQRRMYQESMKTPPRVNDEEMKAVLGGCEECKGKGGDLFGKNAVDACTNPKCYAQRMAAYIEIQMMKNPNLVRLSGNYSNIDDIIGTSSYHEINGKKDHCDHEQKGIVVSNSGIGHTKTICRAPECEKHWKHEAPGGHYKPSAEEREARKKAKQKEIEKKQKEDAAFLAALENVKWPMSEKSLGVLLDCMFGRFGYSYMQPVAKRHGIQAVKKTQNGYTSRDLDTPLREWVDCQDKSGKLRFIFEVALEANAYDRAKYLKRL
jgi:ParB family transcriptional regulator, chromosome partitioning protein